jgi:hypothetical protein
MAEQAIQGINPNISAQAEGIAGSAAANFTGTERKIIEEMGGKLDPKSSFFDVLKNKPLNAKVENQEITVKSDQDVNKMEQQVRQHRKVLQESPYRVPRERVEIKQQLPDTFEESEQPKMVVDKNDQASVKKEHSLDIHQDTVAIVKELNLKPSEILDKFNLEQKGLLSLVSRIKDFHLKRLLTESEVDFSSISDTIKKDTLASAKPASKAWLSTELDKLTKDAAIYKLKLLKSLQSLEYTKQRENNINWLTKVIAITPA